MLAPRETGGTWRVGNGQDSGTAPVGPLAPAFLSPPPRNSAKTPVCMRPRERGVSSVYSIGRLGPIVILAHTIEVDIVAPTCS